MVNVLTIAIDHVGNPEAGLAFFDQSILNPDEKSKAPMPPQP